MPNGQPETDEIFKAIAKYIPRRALISITGSGGKTSLMFYLARVMSRTGKVICSTTTKLCLPYPCKIPVIFAAGRKFDELKASIRETLGETSPVLIGKTEDNGKLLGISPDLACRLFEDGIAPRVIVEADGARSMPFKAYESHEPVMPALTSLHIVIAGSEVLKSPLSRENVFRFELLQERWGICEGEILSRDKLAEILNSPSEYLKGSPEGAKRLLFFNKYDTVSEPDEKEAPVASHFDKGSAFLNLFKAYDTVIFTSLKNDEVRSVHYH